MLRGVALLLLVQANAALPQGLLSAMEREIADIVKSVKPSVVTVRALKVSAGSGAGGLLGIFGDRRSREQEIIVGSGLLVSSDGFVLTKESVVRNADRIEVDIADDATYPAELVTADSINGPAVLKIHVNGLRPARIGIASDLDAGSWVTVIGNALGVPQAVSVGIVSAIPSEGGMQISANVDPGSNGSPVFDTKGHAVGMIAGRVGIAQSEIHNGGLFTNTALAYSLSEFLPFVRSVAKKYYDSHGWLGVTVVADGKDAAPRILTIVEGGPAHKAGLQVGDIIKKFGAHTVDSHTLLSELVCQAKPDEDVLIVISRLDQEINMNVRLGPKIPLALTELKTWGTTSPPDENEMQIQKEQLTPEPKWLHHRINALEKELRVLKSLYQKQ
ncbi:PDZ domain-containing protein [Cytophagia bacterium CHB2]|nr:PDZ domain-containing protein [Cytophagia bacterium CHB2]